MLDRIGQSFGNYQILRLLDQGNFAEVYLGEHRYLEVSAAIKILHTRLDETMHEKFRREARTIAHLQHPHIIHVLDFGFQERTPYLIMDYVPNGTLRKLHPKGSRLSLGQIVSHVKEIAPALDYAHQQRVIHCDVKPENILLNAQNELILSDFGIAVVQQTIDSHSEGKWAGTPSYIAPEQLAGKPCPASDQYALAILVYEWLTGEPPFRGSLYEILAQHLHQAPPSLCAQLPGLPSAVEDTIFGALAKDPQQRFPSVQDFAMSLEEACIATQSLPTHQWSSIQNIPLLPVPTHPTSTNHPTPLAKPKRVPVTTQQQPSQAPDPDNKQTSHVADQPTRFLAPVPRPASSSKARTNRHRLLKRVRSLWIEGVLEHSLHGAVLLALGLQKQPDAVANPWQLLLHYPDASAHPLQPETRITRVYDDADGELLILGAPGSGKTTLLLELARNLLERAEHDEQLPMPVIFNLSSWAPRQQSIADWLVDELNSKYQVPRKLGRSWVDAEQIQPLLDGLDEVAAKNRTACIQAINTYHQEHSLLPLVVCSRSADYLAHSTRLALHTAVMVQPLTQRQIDAYLLSLGSPMATLYQAIQSDAELRDLATTPLMLSILTLTYQDSPPQEISRNSTISARQQQVFSAYVQRMLHRQSPQRTRYTPQQTIHWLTCLAQQMKRHNQSVFYIERMQPDWLTNKRARARYPRYVEGLIFGLIGMVCVGLLFGLSYYRGPGYTWYQNLNGIIDNWILLFVFIFVFIAANGSLFGLLNGLLYTPNTRDHSIQGTRQPWNRIHGYINRVILNGLCFFAGSIVVSALPQIPLINSGNLYIVGTATLIGGGLFVAADMLIGTRVEEIQPAEVFNWSWSRMRQNLLRFFLFGIVATFIISLLLGLGIGLFNLMISTDATLFGSFPQELNETLQVMQVIGPLIILLSALLGAITRGLSIDMLNEHILVRPNEGIHRSARHCIITGLIVGLIGGLTFGLTISLADAVRGLPFGLIIWGLSTTWNMVESTNILVFTIISAPLIGLISGLRSGGVACVQHVILRVLLRHTGFLPWNYPRFLDHATDHILLRKIGGGYIFVHRLLLEYFANLESIQVSELAQSTSSTPTVAQKISRRNVIVGLTTTGIVAVGGGITWWSRTPHPLSIYRDTSPIHTIAWSPDGKYIASASSTEGIQIWQVASGRRIYKYYSEYNQDWPAAIWSPNSNRIASTGIIGEIHIWDAMNGAHRYIYKGHQDSSIKTLAWSPDGKYIASADSQKVLTWNVTNGDLISTYRGGITFPDEYDNALAWSPNSSYIASAGYSKTVQIWNALDGKHIFTYHNPNGVETIAWSPDGKYIASDNGDKTVLIWNPTNGNLIYAYSGHASSIKTVAWSPNSKYVASGSSDETVQVWSALDGEHKFTYWGASGIETVAWSPDGTRIASGTYNGLIQIWDTSGL